MKKSIESLNDVEFHELAIQQSTLFPDLLKCCKEEDVIDSFYDFYKRKRRKRLNPEASKGGCDSLNTMET